MLGVLSNGRRGEESSLVREAPLARGDGDSPSAEWWHQGKQQETPPGSPQTSRPRRPGRRGLDEEEAGGHVGVGRMLWSPLLGVQKPCQPDQGKRYQEELKLDSPAVAAVAAQHVGASQVWSRSGHASFAGQPVGKRAKDGNRTRRRCRGTR